MSRVRRRLGRWRLPAAAALAALVAASAVAGAAAQSPDSQATALDGRITGAVVNGTAGASLAQEVQVELIRVGPDSDVSATSTVTAGGRFAFEAEANSRYTYILRARYEGVEYFSEETLLLSPDAPEAETALTVYETTRDTPALSISRTVVTVLGLDRASAQLVLQREDIVQNPTDRVYIGDAEGATVRFPLPERTTDAAEMTLADLAGTEGEREPVSGAGALASTTPLRPGATQVVTSYVVEYDRDRDAYALRVLAPLETEHIEVVVPRDWVNRVRAVSDARAGEPREFRGVPVLVMERDSLASPGQGLVIELIGLSGQNAVNPLTERTGAAAASVAALAGLALVAVAIARVPALRGRGVEDGEGGEA